MAAADDIIIRTLAVRLRDRHLYKCIDIRERIASAIDGKLPLALNAAVVDPLEKDPAMLRLELERRNLLDGACAIAEQSISAWMANQDPNSIPVMLTDQYEREPYRHFQESRGPLNQIMIRTAAGDLVDVAKTSQIINAVKTFRFYRVYTEGDQKAKVAVEEAISEGLKYAKCA